MADDSIICPLCGNRVSAGISKCPVCSTDLQAVIARKAQKAEGPAEDYLHAAIPSVELPAHKHLCPQCGKELEGTESKCPRCGIPLVREQQVAEQASLKPPEPPPAPAPQPLAAPSPPSSPPYVPVSTPAPIPPIVSPAYGLTNGKGAINGTGLVNGTGITNGTRAGSRLPPGARRHGSIATRWQFLSVLLVLIVIVSSFVYLSYANQQSAPSIDGKFNEWAHVQKFTMNTAATASSINVDQWAVRNEGTRLYLYLKVQGTLMGSNQVDSFYLFVDSDNYVPTGYRIGGLGADFMLEIDGWNGSVMSTSLCRYASASDQYNWTSWTVVGSLSAALVGSQLEAMADMSLTLGPDARYLLLSQNELDQQAVSYVVPREGGSLVITEKAIAANITSGTVPVSANVGFLQLNLLAEGAGGTVHSILPTVDGARIVGDIGPATLKAGESRNLVVLIDTSSSPQGSLVSASVRAANVDSDFAQVTIVGDPARAYIGSPPGSIVIDGAFGDWVGRTSLDTDSTPVLNPDVDIDSTGAVNTTQASYFYVGVKGAMCNGSYVPMLRSVPTGGSGGGGIVVPARVSGEDLLQIYIDSDRNVSTGMPVSMPSKTVGADYLVEIFGMNGVVDKSTFSAFQGGSWVVLPGVSVSAANDAQRIEVGVMASAIAGSSSIDFIIKTTDWRGRGDIASSVPHGVKGMSAGIMAGSVDSWLVDASTTSSSATALSSQRKLFYDGANFWSFYWDGTNTVYRYSADNGVTWSATSQAFKTAGINYASVWYDSSVNILYAVGDRSTASRNVYAQRGSVSPATHAITWAATDRTAQVSQINSGNKLSYICKDAAGYLWILATNRTVNVPAAYDLTAMRSTAIDSVTTWQWRGNMLDTDTASTNSKGSIVPVGSGSQVWTVYTYDGNMASRKYNGAAWTAETMFFTAGRTLNTDTAPPSVLVDSQGVLHCVYGDDNEQPAGTSKPHIFYTYNRGTSWSAARALSGTGTTSGYRWPTISLDTSTGNVYAFWYDMQTNAIAGKKNASGTWTTLTIIQNTYAKQYLTSIYSVPGEQFVCWLWTQNTTAPIQVVFDKLPEFSHVALPVIMMILMFGLVSTKTRRRRKH